jgi:hypothetical protein
MVNLLLQVNELLITLATGALKTINPIPKTRLHETSVLFLLLHYFPYLPTFLLAALIVLFM